MHRSVYEEIDEIVASIEPNKFGCLVWPESLNSQGYAVTGAGKLKVSRILLEREVGRPLVGHALHHCDNRACVKLVHLYEGTDKDNAKDKASRNYDWKYSRMKGGLQ